jgi:hypothetical protein
MGNRYNQPVSIPERAVEEIILPLSRASRATALPVHHEGVRARQQTFPGDSSARQLFSVSRSIVSLAAVEADLAQPQFDGAFHLVVEG